MKEKNEDKYHTSKRLVENTQCYKIYHYLKNGGVLTVGKAYSLGFGWNLRSRICELKYKGYGDNIKTRKQDGQNFNEYYYEDVKNVE